MFPIVKPFDSIFSIAIALTGAPSAFSYFIGRAQNVNSSSPISPMLVKFSTITKLELDRTFLDSLNLSLNQC